MDARETGTVIHWCDARAFGFIRPDMGGRDIFLHVTHAPGGEPPCKGDRLRYRVERGESRIYATDAEHVHADD